MIRRIAYVEEIDWVDNTCRVRIPNIDGLKESEYTSSMLSMLLPARPSVQELAEADIPYHLQGLRVGDVVYVLDSEDYNNNLTIVAFFGGTYKEE